MKKRVTVYIDSGVWDELKEASWELRVSASEQVEHLINLFLHPKPPRNLGEIFVENGPVANIKEASPLPKKSDAEVLAEAQANLERRKQEKAKSTETSDFRPYSKESQLGKRK